MTARAAKRQAADDVVGLLWREDHAPALLAAGATRLTAICGKSYDAALKTGIPIAGDPFWTLMDEADHAAIDAAGETMATRWMAATAGIQFARASAGEIDAPAMWSIGRELAYAERILPRLIDTLGGARLTAIAPDLGSVRLQFDVGAGKALAALGAQGLIRLLPAAPQPPVNEPAAYPSAWHAPEGEWTAFLATGVGFLTDRLREAAARSRQLIVFLDPVESGQIAQIRRWGATQPHVRIVPLYGRNFQDDLTKGREATGWLRSLALSQVAEGDPAGEFGSMLIERNWPRHAALAARFERIFAQPPAEALCSDYRCAETVIFSSLAAGQAKALTILPHSGWPLHELLEVRPASDRRQSRYMTRSGAAEGAQRDARLPASPRPGLVSPPDSLRPNFIRRGIRIVRRLLRLIRPKSRIVIGVVPSLGERHVSSDIPYSVFRSRIESLIRPPRELAEQIEIRFRWRWDEGGRSLLASAGDGVAVVLETQSDRALSHFIRDCDAMIEVGLPTSCHQEAFAQGCAFFRLGEPSALRPRFAHKARTLPELSEPDPWPDLAPYVRNPLRRAWLGARQFLELERDTARGPLNSGRD